MVKNHATTLPIRGRAYTQAGWRQVMFGTDARHRLTAAVDEADSNGVVIVTSPSVDSGTSHVREAEQALGARWLGTFAKCRPHSPVDDVFAILDMTRGKSVDTIVCIGGSSTVDTSKAVSLMLAHGIREEKELLRHVVKPSEEAISAGGGAENPFLKLIGLPTTLAGSEFSAVAGITHASEDAKLLYADPAFYFDTIILDPVLTLKTPQEIWLSSGIKLLDNTIESVCSKGAQPVTTALALEAMRTLPEALRATKRDPAALEPRAQAQYATWMTVFAIHNAWGNIGAALRHQLGATYGIVHGYSSSILVPHILRFVAPHIGRGLAAISDALGAGTEDGGPDAYHRLALDLQLPTRLRDIGVPREALPKIAEGALRQFVAHQTVRPLDQQSVQSILEHAW